VSERSRGDLLWLERRFGEAVARFDWHLAARWAREYWLAAHGGWAQVGPRDDGGCQALSRSGHLCGNAARRNGFCHVHQHRVLIPDDREVGDLVAGARDDRLAGGPAGVRGAPHPCARGVPSPRRQRGGRKASGA
jgi:hypothetical protein